MKTAATHVLTLLLLLAATSFSPNTLALTTPTATGQTDLADAPMASSSTASVKPNVYFILDNSGSMGWEYLPDSVDNNNSKFCFRNHNYNGVYYNPGLPYVLPVDATGASFAAASFTAAKDNGFSTSSATTNLNTGFNTGDDSGGKTAYYYEYTGSSPATPLRGTCYADSSYTKRVVYTVPVASITVSNNNNVVVTGITVNGVQIMSGSTSSASSNSDAASKIAAKITLNGFSANSSGSVITIAGPASAAGYTPAAPTVSSGSATFTRTAFTAVPTAAQLTAAQNFANWYSYYRTRMLTMKTAAGLAFKDIGNSYRVGFSTISYTGTDSTNAGFLNIDDFDYVGDGTGHKEKWYSKLYAASGNDYTPLRGALSKAGRLYAGALLTGANDPVQYSCQQNFTILSTDGYWNTHDELTSVPKYGPYDMANSASVGQQDEAGVARPMNDGESSLKSTSQLNETKTQVARSTSQIQKRTLQLQKRTSTLQTSTMYLRKKTSSNSGSSWSNWSSVSSCTLDTSGTSRTDCKYKKASNSSTDWTASNATWTNATSCTTNFQSSTADGTVYSGNGISCQYAAWSGWSNVSSCTAVAQSAGPAYTGPATDCQTTDTGWVGASSCTPGSSGGATITCQTITTGDTTTPVASCTSAAASSGNNWTQTICTTIVVQPATPVASCTAVTPDAGNSYTTTSCNTVTTGPAAVTTCTAEDASASNNYTATTCGGGTGGIDNTLADVAMYYYKNDLRVSNCTGAITGVDVCENNVPGSGSDVNTKQHMTTFTLGLGVDGTLGYSDNYLSGGSSDYEAIKQGTKNWPDPISNSGAERIDDLWHAAVNGRGVYYSARDPDTLVTGLSNALAGVSARAGSAAAAATSSLQPIAGDNYVFIALYRTVYWDGDLQAKTIDPITGTISSTPIWAAQALLDLKVNAASDTRTIYTYDSTNTNGNHLMNFNWTNVGGTGYFDNICSPLAKLSQCAALISDDATNGTTKATDASGANLVNFLRGQYGNEETIYRDRSHVLGDMVSSQPVYVKKPPFAFVDTNYSAFSVAKAARTPTVYVAANDGMLHAFNGDTGQEQWAYVPAMVLSDLYRLADKTYSANHHYFVDGSPIVSDICPNAPASTCTSAQWKTVLVGGLNAGGRGYYALDITDPAAPKALWNFTSANDADLGYSFGNPIITKRKDGTWVVAVTSGYNNVSPGDGKGYLYILNANTGALLEKIGTGVGSTSTPSGLSKINAWINVQTDNTAERFYGGDLFGNLWRITLDSATPPASPVSTDGTAMLLAEVGSINGAGVQPITTKPELTILSYGGTDYVVVQFGTGRYLGLVDLSNTDQQSIYAIKDTLSSTGLGLVRTNGVLVEQTLSNFTGPNGEHLRTTTTNPVDWAVKNGWYVDLNPGNDSPGERVNIDVVLELGILTVAANVPNDNACNIGGYGFLYHFDFSTGQYLQSASSNTAGERFTGSMFAGISKSQLSTGETLDILATTGGELNVRKTPPPPLSGGAVKRVSWRELIR